MAQSLSASDFVARLWNGLGPGVRRAFVWLTEAKFTLGVSGVVRDGEGRVLLLRHRFWKSQCWGLPGGSAHHGETVAATLQREVREETGLEIEPVALLQVRQGRRARVEFVLLARCADPRPEVRSPEILEARFWPAGELPPDLLRPHAELLAAVLANPAPAGWPLP